MHRQTHNKRCRAYLIVLLCSLLLLSACSAAPEFKGFLWKVTDPKHKKLETEFYILGSIHTVSTVNLKFSQKILSRFERSSTVVLEDDPSRLSAAIQEMTSTNLRNYIDLETETKLVDYLAEVGFQKPQIDKVLRFHPYALLIYLNDTAKPTRGALEKYDFRKIPKYPGVDTMLLQSARDAGKNIKFLETDADVMRIWIETCSSKTENSAAISHAIDLLTGAKQVDKRFYDAQLAFEKGDTQHLKNWYFSRETQQSISMSINKKCSIVPRNFFWKSKIIDHLRGDDNTLVIVGAAHLLGKNSLVELLRAEGFKLEMVE